ncbi:hypothetical protein L211DRAFT_837823 [Terfezia boudieri ATCC MYA-4762]|uniref:Tetraspanin n=1 Tax=Terfezia boudieri ATCC MYA-4762 TaxID=1051890 RepID=A0A3N4LM30_9PEZI|nr:hypothetical protein L211DRAFT_837823 [Terfezia boudieri ATCC MYA-4762]
MPSGVTTTFIIAEALFLGTGVMIAVATVLWMKEVNNAPTTSSVARLILISHFPMQALLANAIMIFITTLNSVPALLMPTSRVWLKFHGWLVVLCAIFTLILGLNEWLQTLTTRANLLTYWGQQPDNVQSLVQEKFNCCGYTNYTTPPFITDSVCPSAEIAAARGGCVGPFAQYAERFLNLVFTAAFGVVGLDMLLLLSLAMVIKRRKESLRYRRIDEKRGMGSI